MRAVPTHRPRAGAGFRRSRERGSPVLLNASHGRAAPNFAQGLTSAEIRIGTVIPLPLQWISMDNFQQITGFIWSVADEADGVGGDPVAVCGRRDRCALLGAGFQFG